MPLVVPLGSAVSIGIVGLIWRVVEEEKQKVVEQVVEIPTGTQEQVKAPEEKPEETQNITESKVE